MNAVVTRHGRGLWRLWFVLAAFALFIAGIILYVINYTSAGLALVGIGTFGLLLRFGPPPPQIRPGPPMSRNAIIVFLMIAATMLVWGGLSFWRQWPDSDPRSIGHYVPVFYGAGAGFLVMIKTDDWRWYLGGAVIGTAAGLLWLVFH